MHFQVRAVYFIIQKVGKGLSAPDVYWIKCTQKGVCVRMLESKCLQVSLTEKLFNDKVLTWCSESFGHIPSDKVGMKSFTSNLAPLLQQTRPTDRRYFATCCLLSSLCLFLIWASIVSSATPSWLDDAFVPSVKVQKNRPLPGKKIQVSIICSMIFTVCVEMLVPSQSSENNFGANYLQRGEKKCIRCVNAWILGVQVKHGATQFGVGNMLQRVITVVLSSCSHMWLYYLFIYLFFPKWNAAQWYYSLTEERRQT